MEETHSTLPKLPPASVMGLTWAKQQAGPDFNRLSDEAVLVGSSTAQHVQSTKKDAVADLLRSKMLQILATGVQHRSTCQPEASCSGRTLPAGPITQRAAGTAHLFRNQRQLRSLTSRQQICQTPQRAAVATFQCGPGSLEQVQTRSESLMAFKTPFILLRGLLVFNAAFSP